MSGWNIMHRGQKRQWGKIWKIKVGIGIEEIVTRQGDRAWTREEQGDSLHGSVWSRHQEILLSILVRVLTRASFSSHGHWNHWPWGFNSQFLCFVEVSISELGRGAVGLFRKTSLGPKATSSHHDLKMIIQEIPQSYLLSVKGIRKEAKWQW